MEREIIKTLGLLSDNERGYRKEVNIMSWNGKPEKIDIRAWEEGYDEKGKLDLHAKAKKGVTLTYLEAKVLRDVLNDLDIESKIGGDHE